ncbi:MAG: M23 family metallopeptidase [Bacteroidales bacterium]|nr:M23 family metallopeptidase [Bacteroidales bacterium]
MRFFQTLFLVVFVGMLSTAQTNGVKPLYINPVNIPVRLAGTFGELRANHFHGGIDIKTQQVEGKPINVIADGFVSRISISPIGYGKTLYIEHTDGRTSVYAHLKDFNPIIKSYTQKEQYSRESYAVELYPKRNELKVTQGDLISYGGNSGSSEGPHLHFEIRETAMQVPLNPLDYGFYVKDFIRPTISLIKVYPHGKQSQVNKSFNASVFNLSGWGPNYRLRDYDTIQIAGLASFGITTYDLLNDESNKNGVKSIAFYIDSVLVSGVQMLRIPFDEGRYINSLCDFEDYKVNKRRIVRTYIEPGNRLSLYTAREKKGVYFFEAGCTYFMKYVVIDFYDNVSVLRFVVKGTESKDSLVCAPTVGELVSWNKDFEYKNNGIILNIPANSLYDSMYFNYTRKDSSPSYLTAFHLINEDLVAFHSSFSLRLKADTIPVGFENKMIMVKIDEKGRPSAVDSKYENAWVHAKLRGFGTYSIMLDTTAPVIRPINISQGKSVRQQSDIRIKISDNLSGVAKYRASLNSQWILMEYDPKNSLLTYYFDDKLKSGSNTFALEVTDFKGNSRSIKLNITN